MTGDGLKSLSEDMLHGWVDGRLTARELAAVEAAREADPALKERLDAWLSQRNALSSAFEPVLDEPVPARICLDRLAVRHAARRRALRAIAAGVLIAVVAGAGGWIARDLADRETAVAASSSELPRTALSAHRIYTVEVRHAVEVGASEEEHLARWLSKRLGRTMPIADLTGEGFSLVGGRLLPDEGVPAAQYMYEDATGLRLTLYATARAGGTETAFRTVSDGTVRAFYWRDHDLGYALVGELPRNRLLKIARLVYAQIEDAAR